MNFLWGASKEAFKYPLIAWNKVYLPVEVGGLVIRRIGLFNQALLGKWLWHFGKESNRFGCQVIATKYGVTGKGWCTRDLIGSPGCGSIRAGAENFFR